MSSLLQRTSINFCQTVLAVGVGISIGLIMSKSGDPQKTSQVSTTKIATAQTAISTQPLQNANVQTGESQPSTPQASSEAAKPAGISLPQIKVVPTLERRMNVLLMGVDSNGRNTQRWLNTRSDTMILVSCDPDQNKVGMISIPRDSRVKLAGERGIDKINAAHALGGPQLAVATVQEAFSVPVDRYVVIDTQGLRKLFQVIGPIQVLVEKRMRYHDYAGGLHVTLDPGVHELTPEQAEQYVRFRHDARGDIGRIERQQWFMRQFATKLREPQTFLKLPQLFQIANEYIQTDLTVEEMTRIAMFGKDIKPEQVQTATVPGAAAMIRGGSYWNPDLEASAVVFNKLAGTPLPVAEQPPQLNTTWPSSAMAATIHDDTNDAPVTVTIKYGRGGEKVGRSYEKRLAQAGYRVRYVIRTDTADCQHEQIIQNSYRADDPLTQKLKQDLPAVNDWPMVVALDNRAPTDFTLIVSPNAQSAATELAPEASESAAAEAPNTGRRHGSGRR